ncbi:MAG: hypothetical protein K6G81_07460 [Lachnospiraceae bacterium]|nr:hypothetical protein [Lachnospiraceae bacterium]
MITWDDHVKFTRAMKNKFGRVKRKLRWHRLSVAKYYCVTFPTNPENKLDIYNMGELFFKRYEDSEDELHIVGLAESRDAAIHLAADIVAEVYDRTDGFDIRRYFKEFAE